MPDIYGQVISLRSLVTDLRTAAGVIDKAAVLNRPGTIRRFRHAPWNELKAVGLTDVLLDIVVSEDFASEASLEEKVCQHTVFLAALIHPSLGENPNTRYDSSHSSPRGQYRPRYE